MPNDQHNNELGTILLSKPAKNALIIELDLVSIQAREVATHVAKCVNSSIADNLGIKKEI